MEWTSNKQENRDKAVTELELGTRVAHSLAPENDRDMQGKLDALTARANLALYRRR